MTMTLFMDRAKLGKAKVLDNGMLQVSARVARVGVQLYRDSAGKTVRMLRRPEEVFAADSLATFALAPLTDDHPQTGRVTADNAKELSVGAVGEAKPDGSFVRSEIRVADAAVIKKIKTGKSQLSSGYTCDVVQGAGNWQDSTGAVHAYDAEQKNIRINHVAVVDEGRAGPEVKLLLDTVTYVMDVDETEEKMEKIVLDGVEFEAPQQTKQAVEAALAKAAGSSDAVKSRLEAAEKQLAEVKLQLDSAMAPEKIQASVKARVALEKHAGAFVQDDLTALSDRQIAEAVLKKVAPSIVCDGKSDEYVAAAFETALATAKPPNPATESIRSGAAAASTAVTDTAKMTPLEFDTYINAKRFERK